MLKIKFWRIENTIVMKILEQGDEIKRGRGSFFQHEGVELRSCAYPCLYTNEILVCGHNQWQDNRCSSLELDNIEKAKSTLRKYIAVIKAYNQKLILSGDNQNEDDIEEVIAE